MIYLARVERRGPIELSKGRFALVRGDIEDQFFILAFETEGQEESQIKLSAFVEQTVVAPLAKTDLDAGLESCVVRLDPDLPRVGQPQVKLFAARPDQHVFCRRGDYRPVGRARLNAERKVG